MKRIGIIGYGEIGSWVAHEIVRAGAGRFTLAALCVKERQREAAQAAFRDTRVCSSLDDLLAVDLDVVVEAAGQGAVAQCGVRILESGHDLLTLSTGALADAGLREELIVAARRRDRRIKIPSGALAGFRGLMALREGELSSVRYTSVKPPGAWLGTPAEREVDLEALTESTVIFSGNASEAALKFPANANLAAAVALAGIGFQRTEVKLVADPHTELNSGILDAEGPDASLHLSVTGRPYAHNPKSSRITGMSVLAALRNEAAAISFV